MRDKLTTLMVLKQLLRRDFLVIRRELLSKLINYACWLMPNLVVFIFILPFLGIKLEYGIFVLIGNIATIGLFTAVSSIPALLNEIEESELVYYYLSLPLPAWLLFVRYALAFSIDAFMVAVAVLPFCKLLLWQELNFVHFSLVKYSLIFLAMQLFVGFFALLLTSYIKNIVQYEKVWVRIIFPLWFFGSYQFPWLTMYQALPYLAYLNLLNPLTYCMEGFRSAILGPIEYLNYWICLTMLLLSTVIVALWGIARLHRRLDTVN